MDGTALTSLLHKIYSKLPVITFDILAVPIAWYLAYWLRYNMQPFSTQLTLSQDIGVLCVLLCIQAPCYYYFKVYRGLWRFSSLNDVKRIIRAVLVATISAIPIFYVTSWLSHIPRSVWPLYSILLATLLCSGRLLLREYSDKRNIRNLAIQAKRVLIIGAGQAGESLIRDLKRMQSYCPIGILDDNLSKRGLEVHGVRVLGTIAQLPEIVLQNQIDLIFIAIPSAGSQIMRRIVSFCESTHVQFRTLPSLHALASGHVEVNALRKVNIEDLLGRDQVQLQWDRITSSIFGTRVLITGGGGSIGSELCRQVARLQPQKLMILDNNEYNLYQIELQMQQLFPAVAVELALMNVTDSKAVDRLFKEFKPEIVFHAAAYKHVPMLEKQIHAAVFNNVIGTQVIAQASVAVDVAKFILISTDKAVNPTNVMGTTKRVAEIYCQNLNTRVSTQFITVRFGNVLGSVGSVVPLFQKQLEQGGPLTVTHPDVQRYFMTIPEASQLILQAMINGVGGEIFVLDMGEPIKISYLAEQMIRLAGKEPGKDVHIEYTGLRPGEKLFEELFHDSEALVETEHTKLLKAQYRSIDWMELMQTFRMIHTACAEQQEDELKVLLKSLVPEFKCELIPELV